MESESGFEDSGVCGDVFFAMNFFGGADFSVFAAGAAICTGTVGAGGLAGGAGTVAATGGAGAGVEKDG